MGKYLKKKASGGPRPGDRRQLILAAVLAALLLALVGLLIWLQSQRIDPQPNPPAETSAPPASTASTASTEPTETAPQETTPFTQPQETVPTETLEPGLLPLNLGSGLVITDIGPYLGAYVEDGTDEVISDVLMVILENTSHQALEYAQLTLAYGEETAAFTVTTLPAGAKVVLLEKNRMAYTAEAPSGILLENVVFRDTLDLYPELFQITGTKGNLTVKNISQQTVTGEIYVYYKNSSQDLFYGGITYRAKIEGGLAPGESKTVIAGHYNPTASTILMVTYLP